MGPASAPLPEARPGSGWDQRALPSPPRRGRPGPRLATGGGDLGDRSPGSLGRGAAPTALRAPSRYDDQPHNGPALAPAEPRPRRGSAGRSGRPRLHSPRPPPAAAPAGADRGQGGETRGFLGGVARTPARPQVSPRTVPFSALGEPGRCAAPALVLSGASRAQSLARFAPSLPLQSAGQTNPLSNAPFSPENIKRPETSKSACRRRRLLGPGFKNQMPTFPDSLWHPDPSRVLICS